MNQKELQERIDAVVRESILEMQVRNVVKNIISEALNEASFEQKKSGALKGKRNYVNNLLSKTNKDFFGHAELSYKLWPNLDPDSARSKMSKCIRGERQFTDADVAKLYELLRKSK